MFADLGLLALRLTLGLVFLSHGAQKAFGAFGGPGFAGATGFIGSLGFRPARLWAAVAVGGGRAPGGPDPPLPLPPPGRVPAARGQTGCGPERHAPPAGQRAPGTQ